MTHGELLELSIAERDWYLNRIGEQREADAKAMREGRPEE